MKTINFIFIIFVFVVSCAKEEAYLFEELYPESIACMNMQRPKDSYNYPVVPGTKKWESFHSHEEMLKACQVPGKTLKRMSTQAVIQAIWEHPLIGEVFHRYQYQDDFDTRFSTNIAYQELLKRKDAGAALYERLDLVNPLTPRTRFESYLLELLISQPPILSQLNTETKMKVVEIVFQRDALRKTSFGEGTWRYSINAVTWLLIGRMMVAVHYVPFVEVVNGNENLKFFLEGSIPIQPGNFRAFGYNYVGPEYEDARQQVISYAKDFINE